MRIAALKRQVRELVDQMGELADRLEAVSGEIDQIEPWLPYRYSPAECRVEVGILKFKRRPVEAITRVQYWDVVAAQFGDMLDDADDRDHWIRAMQGADSSLHGGNLSEKLILSDYFREAIGSVPERIFPEEFQYDPERAASADRRSLEEIVYAVWAHA